MKSIILITFLCTALLLGGCMQIQLDEEPQAVQTSSLSTVPAGTDGLITKEEAEAIALNHAGFTADQVSWLRANYELDDGVHQYEVQFHHGRWEYDYEITAKTGEILSYDRDD